VAHREGLGKGWRHILDSIAKTSPMALRSIGLMAGDLDAVWKALSDSTRRAILGFAAPGSAATTDIVGAFLI